MAEELRQKIIYLREVKKLSFPQIGEMTGVSRKTASRIYRGNYQKRAIPPKQSRLDKYYSLIDNWFKEYPRIKAKQIHHWLMERDVAISYVRVVQYTRPWRKKKAEIYYPLYFPPGEEGQVDWFFVNHPRLGKLCCFALILSYSRYLFAFAFPRSSFEFFIEGHLLAFSYFNGLPQGLRYDNLKSVFLKISPQVRYNPRFLEFSRHYRLDIHRCNPYSAHEKGRIERANRNIKEGFFTIAANYSTIPALNYGLKEWIDNKNRTIHRSTGKRPIDMLAAEKLRPLPAIAWENVTIHLPEKTTKTGMMIYDTNYYSIPDYLTGKSLSVHAGVEKIKIYSKDKEIASHRRNFGRNQQITNPLHRSYTCLSDKAKSQRIYEVIKNLDPAVNDFLLKNEAAGENPQKTAYTVFKLLKGHSRGMLCSIIRECISRKSPRLKSLLECLYGRENGGSELVSPQNKELLTLDYKKRSLEEYEK